MDDPKVSVLIPLYNRKEYAAQCIDSALNQTFQEDYEILIRDDCSTDGVFEFVKERYSEQIASGKIKLFRNKDNVGEFATVNRLFKESIGKYVMILHNDDMYLPHALQHLYEVAEKTNADVVHESFFLNSPKSGIINDIKDCKPVCWDKNAVKEVTIMPNNPLFRFKEWIEEGTFWDMQYNLFSRKFIVENDMPFVEFENKYASLWWIMTAKVFVKTPVVCYICRNSPDAASQPVTFAPEKIEHLISMQIETLNAMDKNFERIDFFKNNEYARYLAKTHMILALERFWIIGHKFYINGITPELYKVVAKSFKEKFGENYFYPMFFFNWANAMRYNRKVDTINFENNTPPHLCPK